MPSCPLQTRDRNWVKGPLGTAMHIVNCVWGGKKRNENLWIFSVKNENHYKKFNIIIISMVTDICNDILGHEDKIKY